MVTRLWAKMLGEMKDLNSLVKLEHLGNKHIEWNQFSHPFTKGQISQAPLAPKIAMPCCYKVGMFRTNSFPRP